MQTPGHHAEAGRYAQKELGLKKVMVLDWDAHHGNGIEDAFQDDDTVLFISMHWQAQKSKQSTLSRAAWAY